MYMMFSFDKLFIDTVIPYIGNFVLANKFTLLAVYYALDKIALYSKTTIDDKILTLLKNCFLRCIGKGNIVIDRYRDYTTPTNILKRNKDLYNNKK